MEFKERRKIGNNLLIIGVILLTICIVSVIAIRLMPKEIVTPPIQPTFTLIDRQDIKDQNVTGFTTIDIRPSEKYNLSHFGGSINIPYGCGDCFRSMIAKANLSGALVIYGENSIPATEYLFNLGYPDLYIVTDWKGWLKTTE